MNRENLKAAEIICSRLQELENLKQFLAARDQPVITFSNGKNAVKMQCTEGLLRYLDGIAESYHANLSRQLKKL